MKKQRAPDMTDDRLELILSLLDGWSQKLTWDGLIEAVAKETGITYSRFTLAEYPRIANAFKLRKDALRGVPASERATPRDERHRAALDQVARYKARAERLEAENQLLLEQFVTWAINAERKGVSIDSLNAALPKPARARTKGEKA